MAVHVPREIFADVCLTVAMIGECLVCAAARMNANQDPRAALAECNGHYGHLYALLTIIDEENRKCSNPN